MDGETPIELEGLRVCLDRLLYRPGESPTHPHLFVYFLSIHNDSDVAVTIKGRKWIVRHEDGEVVVVEGDGVVGQTPTILPNDAFSYNSQHQLHCTRATAEGAYLGVDENGRRIVVRIPRFTMEVPQE